MDKDAYIKKLEKEVVELKKRIEELERLLGMNSKNSSKPPSSNPPGIFAVLPKRRRKKHGAKNGHQPHLRQLLPPEKVTHRIELKPQVCPCGGTHFEECDEEPMRHLTSPISLSHRAFIPALAGLMFGETAWLHSRRLYYKKVACRVNSTTPLPTAFLSRLAPRFTWPPHRNTQYAIRSNCPYYSSLTSYITTVITNRAQHSSVTVNRFSADKKHPAHNCTARW